MITYTDYFTIQTKKRYEILDITRTPSYREDNADAHLKRMILGHQVVVPVTNGKLDFGPWERVHYGEFDGCRPKRILFKAIGA
jgi:thiamine phosphate synthase YjbQ (UPF0047 family)